MRYLTGKNIHDVKDAARENGLSPDSYRFVVQDSNQLSSLRGATIEYVGMRPSAAFMETARMRDINVVKFDDVENRDGYTAKIPQPPSRTMVGDIEVIHDQMQNEYRARKGDMWIIIDPRLIEHCKGNLQLIIIELIPQFNEFERNQNKAAEYQGGAAFAKEVRQTADGLKAKMERQYFESDWADAYKRYTPPRMDGASVKQMMEAAGFTEEAKQLPPPPEPELSDFEENQKQVQEGLKAIEDALANGAIQPERAEEMRREVEAMRTNLILAGDKEEAAQFAAFMGFNNWEFLDHYRKLMNYGGSIVYVVGGGRDREDFGAIEGLFIQKNITQVDMEG